MGHTTLVSRWGTSIPDPTEADMRGALAELSLDDAEHPDCWLEDEAGWALAAFSSGLVTLENVETDQGPWHQKDQSQDAVLRLWKQLQSGKMDDIRSEAWIDGYGS